VRLRSEKVEALARKITASLTKLSRLEMIANPDNIEGAVRRVIMEDLKREEDLEKEAEGILKQYQQKIMRQNLSYNTLMEKTKRELAKKRRIIL
jgi:hypothetical protein